MTLKKNITHLAHSGYYGLMSRSWALILYWPWLCSHYKPDCSSRNLCSDQNCMSWWFTGDLDLTLKWTRLSFETACMCVLICFRTSHLRHQEPKKSLSYDLWYWNRWNGRASSWRTHGILPWRTAGSSSAVALLHSCFAALPVIRFFVLPWWKMLLECVGIILQFSLNSYRSSSQWQITTNIQWILDL